MVLLLGAPLALSSAYAQEATDSTVTTAAPVNAAAVETLDATAAPVDTSTTDSLNETADMSASIDTSSVATSDAAANAATTAEASTADTHSQYGLGALWEQGDVIARGTLIIMIINDVIKLCFQSKTCSGSRVIITRRWLCRSNYS